MATFLLAHGAWSSAFAWKKMRRLMAEAGHELITPSLTGLGERVHLAGASVDLETHISDILQVMFHEDLTDVNLIGHSYGGMVATGVLDRAQERIRQVTYLDAFVPQNGQALSDLWAPEFREKLLQTTEREGDGWRVPSNPLPSDTPADMVDWLLARRHPQPLGTLTTPLALENEVKVPRAYIYCTKVSPGDPFRRFLERAKSEPGWSWREIEASHNPHITVPDTLLPMLLEAAGL